MITLDYKKYYTVDEFRQRCGFSNCQRIYRAIRDGRIDGVVKASGIYLIPMGAVILDRRVKTGNYIGVRKRIRENMENNQ